MSSQEFRQQGYAMVDWIADYWSRVEKMPVLSQAEPNAIYKALPDSAPRQGESLTAVMQDMETLILPGITHWQSPNFFAYFPTGASGPSILGDMLSSGLGVQGMLWSTSPACTELEMKMMDWLVQLLGLPEHYLLQNDGGGTLQDSASSGCLVALLAAREKVSNSRLNSTGGNQVDSKKLVAYISTQTHSSLEKAMMISGLGTENLRKIDVDSSYSMRTELLQQQITQDKADGYLPFFVCATLGTTSSNGMDDLVTVGKIASQEELWLHVDAAMSGTAAICPEFRDMHKGIEGADSYNFNPHKWMFTNFDCSALFVKHKADIINALSILPEYLKNAATESGAVIDYRDWQIPLGRRFRALKLWFTIRHYGVEGLQHHIREHVAIAREFASWVEASDKFEIVAPHPLNLVCFRLKGSDAENAALLNRLNDSGKMYLTHTKLDGNYVLRFCVGQEQTTMQHVKQAWELIQTSAKP
ncbi:MAG: aspartate aminotransferase family protein [Gammaproteobacteria bacterium]|nr:aspartate aminotransferase family protein [Gammaproteobacteria bacterium]